MEEKKHSRLSDLWLYRTEPGRWITAAVMSMLMIAAVYLVIEPVFMTIDDARLRYVYAGYSTGKPESLYLFCYYPLSVLLSFLYTHFPVVNWYAVHAFGMILLSNILLGKTIYKICSARKIHFILALVIHLVTYASLALISTIVMHFEITAALLGAAGVVLVLGADYDQDSKATRILDGVLTVFCLTACFVIIFNAFYAAVCYLLVAIVYALLKGYKNAQFRQALKHVLLIVVCVAILVVGIKLTDGIFKDHNGWTEYKEYNKYRVPFWDYPHASYQDDPELYESIGWSSEFYDLTQEMYFMDQRFTGENLSQVVDKFSWLDFDEPQKMAETMVTSFKTLFKGDSLVRLQIVCAVLVLLCLIVVSSTGIHWTRYYPQLIAMWCCTLGTVVLMMFLASRGRYPVRVWLSVSIPCVAVLVCLLLTTVEKRRYLHRKPVLRWIAGCVLGLCWIGGMCYTYRDIIQNDWKWRDSFNTSVTEMEQYCIDHPDHLYVYDLMGAQNYNVFSQYPDPDQRPSNAVVWGSSYIFSPPYYDQMERNGRTELFSEDFYDEDVFFIGYQNEDNLNRLLAMLNHDFGPTKAEKVDTINFRFNVYKIQKVQDDTLVKE